MIVPDYNKQCHICRWTLTDWALENYLQPLSDESGAFICFGCFYQAVARLGIRPPDVYHTNSGFVRRVSHGTAIEVIQQNDNTLTWFIMDNPT